MKLTINKKYKNINMMNEVETLSDIHQSQLEVAIKSSFGNKKLTIKKAITKDDLSADFSEILDENGNALYDFWELNVDSGKLFKHNSTDLIAIAMIQSGFTVDERKATDEETSLIADLESADTTHNLLIYKYNNNQEIADFIDTPVPKNSKAWTEFISRKSIGGELINAYSNQIDKKCWDNIIRTTKCSEQFIETFMDNVNWDLVSEYQNLSENFIEKHQQKINWKCIAKSRKTVLSENFIEKFQNKIDWKDISSAQKLSESFITKHSDKIDWKNISRHQKLSDSFIIDNKDKLDWSATCECQIMTEATIRQCLSNFNGKCWEGISFKQSLSIPFIEEFQHNINWKEFSRNRGKSLTEEVLRKYANKIDWSCFINDWSGPGLSEEMIKELLPFFKKSHIGTILGDPDNFPISKEYKNELQKIYENY